MLKNLIILGYKDQFSLCLRQWKSSAVNEVEHSVLGDGRSSSFMVKPFLLSHRRTAMTTYSEAVYHAGQHTEKVYTMYIYRHVQNTYKAQTWIAQFYLQISLHHACL